MEKIERKYYKNGQLKIECYFKNNSYHRKNGPAIICYYESGNKEDEYWYENGIPHRHN